MLLPTMLTWAVNRLSFEQRGRGTGLWTGTLFIGEFLSPLVIAALGAGVGGLQPALAVLAVLTLVVAAITVVAPAGTPSRSTSATSEPPSPGVERRDHRIVRT